MADDNIVKLLIETSQKTYIHVVKLKLRFPCIIGRQSPDISIPDSSISRKHCQLLVESKVLFIEDLGSSNGVDVNGAKVKRVRLRLDDHIKLGNTRIKVIQISLTAKKANKASSF